MKRASKPIAQQSAKRRSSTVVRSETRRVVIARDGGQCAGWGIPGCPHDHPFAIVPDGRREVHELQGGIMRNDRFCDPEWTVLTCHALNQWISNGSPREAERRGLRLPSWCGESERTEAAALRQAWRNGEQPCPSWWPTEIEEQPRSMNR